LDSLRATSYKLAVAGRKILIQQLIPIGLKVRVGHPILIMRLKIITILI